MESIGDKIKKIRTEKRLSQKYVADTCGITPSAYLFIENGTTKNITLKVAKGLSKALEVPFNELFEIESVTNNHEINRLKGIVFQSLELYESEQLFFGQFEHDHLIKEDFKKWEENQKKFEEYSKHLKEFKRGILKILILNGFCTQEDVTDFYNYIHHRGKYAVNKPASPDGSHFQ